MRINKNNYSTALLLLIVFIVIQHICFFLLNEIPVIDHEYYHTGHVAVESYYELKEQKWNKWIYGMFGYTNTRQPQMIGRLMGFTCYVFGLNRFVMRQINLIFYILLILSSYHLGKKLFNRKTGFWGAFVVASMPLIISHSRMGDLHFFATTLFIISLLTLVRSNRFTEMRFSVLFGILFGLTLHTHETILLHSVILFTFLFLDIFFTGTPTQKKNFILSYSIILLFFLPFYLPAFIYSIGNKGMRLHPWSPDLAQHYTIFFAFSHFLKELKQGLGRFNFYAVIAAYAYLIFVAIKQRASIKSNYYILLFTILTAVPFLAIVIGSIYFREINTLQHLMPSYPLLCLLLVYVFGKIKFNLGIITIFISNIWLWFFIVMFMVTNFFNIDLDIKYPEPLTHGQDTKMNTMFYPQKAFLLNAKKVRSYFKDILKEEEAIIYGFLVPKQIIHCSYFDELQMHGIIQPDKPGSLNNVGYTDRNRKQECQKTIYLILIYKYMRKVTPVALGEENILVDVGDYPLIKNILHLYRCKILKEFYNPKSGKKAMTVIKGIIQ